MTAKRSAGAWTLEKNLKIFRKERAARSARVEVSRPAVAARRCSLTTRSIDQPSALHASARGARGVCRATALKPHPRVEGCQKTTWPPWHPWHPLPAGAHPKGETASAMAWQSRRPRRSRQHCPPHRLLSARRRPTADKSRANCVRSPRCKSRHFPGRAARRADKSPD
jgi:hypothetical protein